LKIVSAEFLEGTSKLSVAPSDDTRRLLENALRAIEVMQQRLDAVTNAQREPVAMIGAACRFPGGIRDLPSYWQMLRNAGNGVSDLGRRFDFDEYYHPDPNTKGKTACRWGGLLDDIEQFDAELFGISPKAALCMDPQQRMMLEVAWEAIESAGYDPLDLPNKQGGVFVATGPNEYAPLLLSAGLGMEPSANMATGNSASVVAGRLSYLFGWNGPAAVVDTACSSSLVAVHMACQSLRSRECDLAIAGGVNLILSPLSTVVIGRNGMLAADSRCKVFDAAADGYIRSEGAAILVFKRLSDALAHRDHILAVVRGSAVTHNGRSQGLTAPSGPSQEAVIKKALEQSGVATDAVSYVETHGTGTALGDPIEVASLAATYGKCRSADHPLLIGSVKANIGHCETVAGAAGLLKLVLCLQHRSIPRQVNLTRISPHLEQWLEGDGPMRVARAELAWDGGPPRIGAVSSFGFSGTNAHAVVEQAPDISPEPIVADRDLALLTLSARSAPALRELARRYADALREASDHDLGNICFTANTGRSRFSHRLAAWGSRDALAQALTDLAGGNASPNGLVSQLSGEARALTFHFPGTVPGAVPSGIEAVCRASETFRKHVDLGEEFAQRHLGASVQEVLFDAEGDRKAGDQRLNAFAQFVLKSALAHTLIAWGVEPGELCCGDADAYVAASLAGVMSFEAAAKLFLARGDAAELARLAQATELSRTRIPLRSIPTGKLLGAETGRHEFWCRLHSDRMERRTGPPSGTDGNYRVCFGSDSQNEAPEGVQGSRSVIDPDKPLWAVLMSCLGQAYLAGSPIDFAAIDRGLPRRRVPLPTYPFARRRYWPDNDQIAAKAVTLRSRLRPTDIELEVTPTQPLHLADHRLVGEMVFPGAAHLALAFEAVARAEGQADITFENVVFPQLLELDQHDRRVARYRFSEGRDGRFNCRGESRGVGHGDADSAWTWHLAAELVPDQRDQMYRNVGPALERMREFMIAPGVESSTSSCSEYYDRLEQFGYQLGASFRWVATATRGPEIAFAALQQPEVRDATSAFPVSASLLDTCFQVASAALPAGADEVATEAMYLPFAVDRIQLVGTVDAAKACVARLRADAQATGSDLVHDIMVVDENRRPVLVVEGFRSRRRAVGERAGRLQSSLIYDVQWREAVRPPKSSDLSGEWLVFADRRGVGDALASRLRGDGAHVRCVRTADDIRPTADDLRINPDEPGHMRRLLAEMPNLKGAVHLWALDLSAPTSGSVRSKRVAASTWAGVLHFAQALTGVPHATRQLWICTRRGQAVLATDRLEAPEMATLWGLGRTLMHELTDLQTVLVDVDGGESTTVDQVADALYHELGSGVSGVHERAVRPGGRYEPRLQRRATTELAAPVFRDDAIYLITGGFGGLGLACAGRLIGWGARNLALLSRNPPTGDALRACEKLEGRGASIARLCADVGSRDALGAALDEVRARGLKLGGILHAAGVLNDRVLVRQDIAAFEEVMRPKVDGTWNLHELTRGDQLDFFISFSSMAALLGSPGQSAYAAANACLDALMHYRRSIGLPGVSINWGAWSDIGMAARHHAQARAAVQDLRGATISPAHALDAFAVAFEKDAPPSIAIGNIGPDWLEQVIRHAPSVPAMLRELVPTSAPSRSRKTAVPPSLGELERLSPEERKDCVEDYVTSEVRLVLGIGDDQELHSSVPLLDNGLDSLAAIELRDRLAEATSAVFPASLLFDNPSIARLAETVLSAILPTAAEGSVDSAEMESDGLEQLSSAELHSLLARELHGESERGSV
jgi:acyl transferase domain-containing protein/aryl carrier-like protein